MKSVATFWFVLCAALLNHLPARADAWNDTFTREALQGAFQGRCGKVVVVAAGANRVEVEPAAAAFEQALRGLSLELVMSDDALGDVASADDQGIVKRAAVLPVDCVGVVRTFPGASAESASLVLVVYDKTGSVVAALNGQAGRALASPSVSAQGVKPNVMQVVDAVTKTTSETREKNRKRYQEEHVWFADMAAVNQNGTVVATWSRPFQGKYRTPLTINAFLRTVERPDLAAEYLHKRRIDRGLKAAFYLGLIGGSSLAMYGLLHEEETDECGFRSSFDNECVYYKTERGSDGALIAGLLVTIAGVGAGIGALVVDPMPINIEGARRLADEHNAKLRGELGISEAEAGPVAAASPAKRSAQRATTLSRLAIVPRVGQHRGGLQLSISF